VSWGHPRLTKCCRTLANDVPELARESLSAYQASQSVKWTVRMIDEAEAHLPEMCGQTCMSLRLGK
jgi:hypothetical protein